MGIDALAAPCAGGVEHRYPRQHPSRRDAEDVIGVRRETRRGDEQSRGGVEHAQVAHAAAAGREGEVDRPVGEEGQAAIMAAAADVVVAPPPPAPSRIIIVAFIGAMSSVVAGIPVAEHRGDGQIPGVAPPPSPRRCARLARDRRAEEDDQTFLLVVVVVVIIAINSRLDDGRRPFADFHSPPPPPGGGGPRGDDGPPGDGRGEGGAELAHGGGETASSLRRCRR